VLGGLQYHHFAAKTRPDRAELETDDTGPDDAETLGDFLEFESPRGIDHHAGYEWGWWNFDWHRASSEDHMLGGNDLFAAIGRRDFDLAILEQPALAADSGDAVGLEQPGDATRELLHDLDLAGNHGWYIDLQFGDLDAVHIEAVCRLGVLVRGIEQGFGGDAAHVETGAAVHGRLHAQLRGLDGSHVSAGAGPDHHYIVIN